MRIQALECKIDGSRGEEGWTRLSVHWLLDNVSLLELERRMLMAASPWEAADGGGRTFRAYKNHFQDGAPLFWLVGHRNEGQGVFYYRAEEPTYPSKGVLRLRGGWHQIPLEGGYDDWRPSYKETPFGVPVTAEFHGLVRVVAWMPGDHEILMNTLADDPETWLWHHDLFSELPAWARSY